MHNIDRDTGLLVIMISLAGLVVAFVSLVQHVLSYQCVVLMLWPKQVVCPSLIDTVLPDFFMMIPNFVGLLVGLWIYRQQPTNRNEGEKSKP